MVRRLLCLSLGLLLLPIVAIVQGAPAFAAAPPPCPSGLPDETAALAAAQACGGRIEVSSARSETGQIFANPDGTSTVEQYAYPQRVRRADGSWASLDATLVANPDGTYSPRASIVDLKLSGGGGTGLITGRRHATAVSLSWPEVLPAPQINGASATYADVFPGVDLVVTAHETGFSEVLVVKNRAAARNPKLRKFAFGSALSGLSWRTAADGRLEAVDGNGSAVLGATAPRMWDSSVSPAGAAEHGGRARGDRNGPAEGATSAPMALTLEGTQLSLEPAAAMLDDPRLEYPVYLDPTIVYSGWTMINSDFPSQSYWSYDKTDCPSPFTGECAKVGHVYGYATMKYRSLWQFSTNDFRGKLVTSAKFTIDLLYSAYASNSYTDLHKVNATIGSGTNWSNNNGLWGSAIVGVNNYSKPAARKLSEFGITGTIQSVAGTSATTVTFGLKARNESTDAAWKKFDAKTARLVVSLNNKPNKPDTLTVDGRTCVAGVTRPVISTATPILKGRVTDPDGHSMQAFYAWAKWNGTSFVDVGSGNNSPHASGAYAQITTGTLVDGGIYTFRMQTNDSASVSSGTGTSDVTHMPGNCEWEVDLQNPTVPSVDADVYEEDNVGCPAAGCGSVGQTGRFTFSSSSDVVSYRWGWTSPPTNVLNPAATGGTVTLDWTPPSGGAKSLFVQAIDRAGRTASKTYQFTVAPPSTAVARWKFDEFPGATDLIDDTGNGWTATAFGDPTLGADGRILPGFDGASRTAVGFDGVDDYVTASENAMPDSSRSFTVAVWARVDDTGVFRTVIGQGGTNQSTFWLDATDTGRWRFVTTSADTATATNWSALSTSVVRPGTWTHLAAVYDSAAKTMTLYVNGVAEGTATGVTTWDGSRPVRVSGSVRPWKGAVAEVQLWNRVISASEVFALVDPINVGKAGEWHMDEVGPGPAFDASGMARDLTFYGGAEIPPSGAGQTGTGLRLDGVDDYVSPDAAALYTDQSFTVSVWVRPLVTTGYQTFVTQYSDATVPGFSVYHGATESEWKCKMGASSTDGSSEGATLVATAAPDTASYHHLVCVFDAQKQELRLYLDGVLKDTTAMNAAWQPWRATGAFVIGHMQGGSGPTNWTNGDVDEVRVYQGVVADVTRIP